MIVPDSFLHKRALRRFLLKFYPLLKNSSRLRPTCRFWLQVLFWHLYRFVRHAAPAVYFAPILCSALFRGNPRREFGQRSEDWCRFAHMVSQVLCFQILELFMPFIDTPLHSSWIILVSMAYSSPFSLHSHSNNLSIYFFVSWAPSSLCCIHCLLLPCFAQFSRARFMPISGSDISCIRS